MFFGFQRDLFSRNVNNYCYCFELLRFGTKKTNLVSAMVVFTPIFNILLFYWKVSNGILLLINY
jgi:hypothetical protein